MTVSGGLLNITDTVSAIGGLCYCTVGEPQLYGHWEVYARTQVGTGYAPTILLWPAKTTGLAAYEVDLAEFPDGARTRMYTTIHWGRDQDMISRAGLFTGWNTYGVDWGPDHLTLLFDGKPYWTDTNYAEIPHIPMFLGLQEEKGPQYKWTPAVNSSTPAKVTFSISDVKIWSKPAMS